MITWVRVERELPADPRVYALADGAGLSVDAALGKLVRLYAAMAVHAPTGDLSGVLDEAIEDWVCWRGEAGVFASALRDLLCEEGVLIGWAALNGAPIQQAQRAAERKRIQRQSKDRPRNGAGQSADGPRTIRDLAPVDVDVDVDVTETEPVVVSSRVRAREQACRTDTTSDLSQAARDLTASANQAITAAIGEQPQMLRSGHPDSYALAEWLLTESGIPDPVKFARPVLADVAAKYARKHGKAPGSLAYFRRPIEAAWEFVRDAEAAKTAPPPGPVPGAITTPGAEYPPGQTPFTALIERYRREAELAELAAAQPPGIVS